MTTQSCLALQLQLFTVYSISYILSRGPTIIDRNVYIFTHIIAIDVQPYLYITLVFVRLLQLSIHYVSSINIDVQRTNAYVFFNPTDFSVKLFAIILRKSERRRFPKETLYKTQQPIQSCNIRVKIYRYEYRFYWNTAAGFLKTKNNLSTTIVCLRDLTSVYFQLNYITYYR